MQGGESTCRICFIGNTFQLALNRNSKETNRFQDCPEDKHAVYLVADVAAWSKPYSPPHPPLHRPWSFRHLVECRLVEGYPEETTLFICACPRVMRRGSHPFGLSCTKRAPLTEPSPSKSGDACPKNQVHAWISRFAATERPANHLFDQFFESRPLYVGVCRSKKSQQTLAPVSSLVKKQSIPTMQQITTCTFDSNTLMLPRKLFARDSQAVLTCNSFKRRTCSRRTLLHTNAVTRGRDSLAANPSIHPGNLWRRSLLLHDPAPGLGSGG